MVLPGVAWTAAQADTELSPELMLFEEVPTVIAATRTTHSIRDVPSSVTVIGADEIRASGALNLQDLLQSVPGLSMMQLSRGDLNVTSRGLLGPSSSSLLVMLDGRSVYLDFFGITTWDHLNVTLQDIERIEVVRGPGSALYGANAFLGTVNIVTKRARDLPSMYVQTGLGPDTGFVTTTGAMSAGRLAMKGSVQYRTRDHFRNKANTAANTDHGRHDTASRERLFNATLEYMASNGTDIRFSGGTHRSEDDIQTSVGVFDYDGPATYLQLNLGKGPWKAQAFYTHNQLDLDTVITTGPHTPGMAKVDTSVVDFDLQRTIGWGSHQIVTGLNVRQVLTGSSVILGSREEETLYSGFLQGELKLTEQLTTFLGARLDEHPKSGFQASPRIALVYKFGETGRIRASYARSFQNPTHIDSYASYQASPFITVVGNEDLDPVWVTAYELGMQMQPHRKLQAQLDLFLNQYKDHQSFVTIAPGLPTVLGFMNTGRTKTWGGELSLEWRWSPSLRAFGSYSYQAARGPLEHYTPVGRAAMGVRGSPTSRIRYALTGVWAGHDEYEPSPLQAASLPDLDIRSRFTVDGFLGVELREGLEVGLHARNLFHQVRRHHPIGAEIGSELILTVTASF